jgi:cell division protein FtsL
MMRLNFVLLVVAVACALATVAASHRGRKLFADLEREQERMRQLEVEWGQLQLEQSTWAGHPRIEKIAREMLAMHPPAPGQVVAIETAAK